MISDSCLSALRMAAVLAYRLPMTVRIEVIPGVQVGEPEREPIIEVSRPPAEADPRARWLPPCAFRGAVVEAWRMHQEGRQLAFCGLAEDAAVAVEVEAPPRGRSWPGGIHSVPWGDDVLLAFATAADPELCRQVTDPLDVSVHTDGALDVSLVHLSTEPERLVEAHDLLVTSLARLTAEELIASAAPAGRLGWRSRPSTS